MVPTLRPNVCALSAAIAAVSMAGCDVEVVWVDPVVTIIAQPAFDPTHAPELEIGYHVEQLYSPIADGDDAPIVTPAQGGRWTMPTLRTRGIDSRASIVCKVTTAAGEVVADASEEQRFNLATDGALEFIGFPLEIRHAPPREDEDIDDLYGVSATLSCTVTDTEGRGAAASVDIVLVEG